MTTDEESMIRIRRIDRIAVGVVAILAGGFLLALAIIGSGPLVVHLLAAATAMVGAILLVGELNRGYLRLTLEAIEVLASPSGPPRRRYLFSEIEALGISRTEGSLLVVPKGTTGELAFFRLRKAGLEALLRRVPQISSKVRVEVH